MKIAHISDLHLLSLEGAVPFRLFNKRLTGYINLRLRRNHHHRSSVAREVAREVHRHQVDHVVITGDVTNLALEQEFETVRRFLEDDLAMPAQAVSVVPGNHDAYTRGAHRSKRFARYLAPYVESDLPDGALVPEAGTFPFARLRGPVVILGLSSAVARPPLIASGVIGAAQRRALHSLLAHEQVRHRTPVILQHHPWHNPPRLTRRLTGGLADATEEQSVLDEIPRGLLLHGHLHRRVHRRLPTRAGHIDAVGATSASLVDARADRMAGFNVYEVSDEGELVGFEAFRLETGSGRFVRCDIPRE